MDARIELSRLTADIGRAFKTWRKDNGQPSPFEGLQLFRQALLEEATTPHEATNKILFELLKNLKQVDQEGAELLSRRFFDTEKMRAIANSLNMSEATAFRRQNEAVGRSAALLQAKEIEARRQRQAVLEQRLERATYTQLIGAEAHLNRLVEVLTTVEAPWLVAIEGLGGIGKTSLAGAIARQMIEQRWGQEIGWVSARQHIFTLDGQLQPVEVPALTTASLVERLIAQLLPQLPAPERLSALEAKTLLRTHLAQRRALIVIDNLETVQDVQELLPTLRELANPAKFLLTSRESYYHEPALYHFPLPELTEADTLRLIRHEIEAHNLTHLHRANDDDLRQVYQVVGGNPLALRLVVGQTHVFSLADILEDLRRARSQTVDEVYTFIYRRAWDALAEPARRLFVAMLLVTDEGEGLDDLAELSTLEVGTVRVALKQLVDLNLVNSSGDHQRRHYSLHNLTRAFLHEQVLKWQ
ncbi:MAG: hypothetical protein DPW09_22635 [Anaerolineae bacterium]|nr:hypothetical protein [Anaerolineales bacterium]MCQ3976235.1 hypothetical protein [Anaerolineae bacterium]